MVEVYSVTVQAWECGGCHWQWIPRGKETPKQCPNRECRQRLSLKEVEVMPLENNQTDRVNRTGEHRAVKTSAGDKRCKHGFPTCLPCGFKDGAKVKGK
jgi:hypothetical protein